VNYCRFADDINILNFENTNIELVLAAFNNTLLLLVFIVKWKINSLDFGLTFMKNVDELC
jgi:hypothetical protein